MLESTFIVILFICAILTWSTGIFILSQRNLSELKAFAMTLVGSGLYCGCYGCELYSPEIREMLMWSKLEYIGISMFCPAWAIFTIQYTREKRLINSATMLAIWLIPLLTVIFKLFDERLGLIYLNVGVDGRFSTLTFTRGPWYYVQTVYQYACCLFGIYMILRYGRERIGPGKGKRYALIAAPAIALVFNVVYMSGISPFGPLDLTAAGICIAALILHFFVFRYDLSYITPVARAFIVEHLPHGVMVFNTDRRLCEANEAARALLALSPSCIGMRADELFTAMFCERVLPKSGRTTFETSINGRDLEVRTNIIDSRNNRYVGWVVSLIDISERKRTEMRLEQLLRAQKRSETRQTDS